MCPFYSHPEDGALSQPEDATKDLPCLSLFAGPQLLELSDNARPPYYTVPKGKPLAGGES